MSTTIGPANASRTRPRFPASGSASSRQSARKSAPAKSTRGQAARLNAQAPVTLSELIQFLDSVAIEDLAAEHGVTARDIVAQLPGNARRTAAAGRFVEVMDDVAGWNEVTIPIRVPGGMIELSGRLPRGELKHGCYYWLGDGALRGHLRHDRCGGIAFVERAFMGRPSAAVLFFDRTGAVMFKIFVPRDSGNALRAAELAAFRALAKRVCRRPAAAVRPRTTRRPS